MTIVLISDSHGYSKAVAAVLETVGDFDAVFHLGDGFRDFEPLRPRYPGKAFYSVCGNCDGAGAENQIVLDYPCGKILLTHGHLYGVKSNRKTLAAACAKAGAKLGIYGHTHTAAIENIGGVTLVCPGSCAFPKETRYPTYGVLNIDEKGRFEAAVVEITPFGARPIL